MAALELSLVESCPRTYHLILVSSSLWRCRGFRNRPRGCCILCNLPYLEFTRAENGNSTSTHVPTFQRPELPFGVPRCCSPEDFPQAYCASSEKVDVEHEFQRPVSLQRQQVAFGGGRHRPHTVKDTDLIPSKTTTSHRQRRRNLQFMRYYSTQGGR